MGASTECIFVLIHIFDDDLYTSNFDENDCVSVFLCLYFCVFVSVIDLKLFTIIVNRGQND